MRLKHFLLVALAALGLHQASAQRVTISPVPQSQTWGDKAFSAATAKYQLVGETTADKDAVRVLKAHFNTGGNIRLVVGKRGDANVNDVVSKIPAKPEGYYLKVTPNEVIIAGNDDRGTFYGVQSFLQIASQPEVMQVELQDYPDVLERGVIEGFYGNPWSERDRISQFDFYAANKMNVYIYGPKDDPYHRDHWRTFYPEAAGKQITRLAQAALKNKVHFFWALHPGKDIQWNTADRDKVIAKLEDMYRLGVRAFAIFFDDIGGPQGSAEKQSELLNYVQKNFIEKHPELPNLVFCPTVYNQAWSGDGAYLRQLKQHLDQKVRIMWTGASVVDMINERDCDWFYNMTGHYPYIWLNYPVTDYCIPHMLMGPTWGNDLNIANKLAGFLSNPMEYAEASKLSLYSLADYAWNLPAYNADASWRRAIAYLMPHHVKAFTVFCENNMDLGSNFHGLRRMDGESPKFRAALQQLDKAKTPEEKAAAYQALRLRYDTLVWAANTLLDAYADSVAGKDNHYLLQEIEPWLTVMRYVGERGQKIFEMQDALEAQDAERFINLYLQVVKLEEAQGKVRSRDFKGSIKNPNPIVADVVVVPFMQKLLAKLIDEYKQHFTYRLDVFPAQLLENGNYYILYNGYYLSNNNKNGVGGNPAFSVRKPSNINPQLQEWVIKRDYATGRYMILNAYDNRYVNEKGDFGTNDFYSSWNTYTLYRFNGKYAIQNGGDAGTHFWKVNNSRVQKSDQNQMSYDFFLFDIVPVDSTKRETYPMIERGKTYLIANDAQKYLTNRQPSSERKRDTPLFDARLKRDGLHKQEWRFNLVRTVGRYNLQSRADNRFVNELGDFTWNPYSPEWNTYFLTEMGGKYAIQNAGQAGHDYWTIRDNRCVKGGGAPQYIFSIVPADENPTGIDSPEDFDFQVNITNDSIQVRAKSPIQEIALFNLEGKKVKRAKKQTALSIAGIDQGAYVLVVVTPNRQFKQKIVL